MGDIHVENESQWLTADLVNIVRRIEKTPGFSRENFYSDTILLFRTSRKKKESSYSKEPPKAAEFISHGPAADRYEDVRLVVIRSVDKIGAEVLDRLANSDVQQDVSPAVVKLLVSETAKAIGGWRSERCDFSWYTDVPLRVGKAPKRSTAVAEREIAALRNIQRNIRMQAAAQVQAIEKRIEKIRTKRLGEVDEE